MTPRYRITVRADAPNRVELRGYFDGGIDRLNDFARAMEPFGLVIASPVHPTYDPFAEVN